ncbi:putative ribonuclease H-like domain-containing protein [Tanacetum coccineum]
MVLKAVLMRSGLVSLTTARPVNTAQPRTTVNSAKAKSNVFKAHSTIRRPINNKTATKNSNFNQKVNTARPKAVLNAVKGNQVNAVKASAYWGNPQQDLQEKGVIDSGCSRHMTGNMSYLTDFEEIDGGYVAFGGNPKGGKITGRGTIKTGNLDFENVYFVRELKFNLFSVSQMCDKKNSVLFNDTECIVLSPNFKLTDESHVLLKVPRKNNMYSVDLKNIVPKGGLTCLFAKATSDESKLWHRRLGHINFKTMNKLVKGNLVRGLPSKLFENDQTCVACQKGKQHRASCKSKTVSSISQPLHMLHMDLFGPTFVKSLMKKMYCLVVTDDYSRFSWVFFLATKDETSGILKSFITGVENLIDQRVKVIRCDNGTEFKNKEMNQFCERKGIKREFSVARTPQQNGVAERKNRTLIEAARTMLADSKLPTTFWAEAVNTACYVQNRVLVTKPHNKTPYELFLGRKPALGFMKPFGCPVTILNTIDHLGKFDGKADEGFFVGAFLYGKIEEDVYVCQPPGFEDLDFLDRVYNVEKALYGLHQAPRAWYETLSTYLLDNEFQRGKIDKTLFIKRYKDEQEQAPTPTVSSQQPSQLNVQDKELAFKLQAEEEGEERLAKEKAQQIEEVNIAWDDVQARQRRKHFAAKRAEEKRNIPPTRAQQRSFMCTYLKNVEGWKPKDLKNKSFVNIQELFDKAMKRVNTFVDYKTELVEESSKKAEAEIAQESSLKRACTELEQESIKKEKVDEDKETTKLQRLIESIPDKEGVAIDAIPLATKTPSIVDYKIHKEGKKTYYQIIMADGSSKMYLVFSHMLKSFDREDLETLWKLVKAKHGSTRPEEGYERVLWGDLKTMFDPYVEDQV